MVNHKSKKIISMINSRDIGEVSEWLKKFSNLKIITRDGSLIYKSAIEMVNSNIIQITDRFHLIKNLSDAIAQELRNILPRILIIDEIENQVKIKTLKERYENTKKDIENGIGFTIACNKNNMNYKTMKKLIKLNELEIIEYFENKETKIRIEKIDKKNKLVKTVQTLKSKGLAIIEIARQTNLDQRTVKKYMDPNFKFSIESTSKERLNSCSKYNDIILNMVNANSKIKEIYLAILKLGYTGKYGMVKAYVSKLKKEKIFNYKEKALRKNIINLLYQNFKEKKQNLDKKTIRKIYNNYPQAKTLIELMLEFKGILLKTKKEKALKSWISKAKKLNISKINAFIKGIERDYDAVLNSIKYNESNGVVESSVHKIKKVKRIMHGRCGFELLNAKTILLEL